MPLQTLSRSRGLPEGIDVLRRVEPPGLATLRRIVEQEPGALEGGVNELARKLLYFSRNWGIGVEALGEHPWMLALSLDEVVIPRLEWITSTPRVRGSRGKPAKPPPAYRNVGPKFVRDNIASILKGERREFVEFMLGEFLNEREAKDKVVVAKAASSFGKFTHGMLERLKAEQRA